jgi:hypothetical protein
MLIIEQKKYKYSLNQKELPFVFTVAFGAKLLTIDSDSF